MKYVNRNGFTVMEVLVSMIILTIGILGLAPLIMVSIYGNSFSNDMTQANALAQREVETLVNQKDYGTMPYIAVVDSVNGVYKVTRTVEDQTTNASVPVGLAKITVVISWTDKKALLRTVNYSTLKPMI
ncbi:MAG: prepilin-type N-terminal cleavage/methylation domain-containing protein [Candidatus Zixiibacteriota bacterium]